MVSPGLGRLASRADVTETRQRLLTAARMLFSTKGYAASATAAIAREAKVSEGTLFYHFASKTGLLVELGRCYAEAMIIAMQGDDDIADLEPGQMITRCIAWSLRQHELEANASEQCGRTASPPCADARSFYHEARHIVVAWLEQTIRIVHARHGVGGADVQCAAVFTYTVVADAIDLTLATDDADFRRAVLAETVRYTRAALGYVEPTTICGAQGDLGRTVAS